MDANKRRLHSRDTQEDLKEWYEYRLLRGLNGQIRPARRLFHSGEDAHLPRTHAAIKRVTNFIRSLQIAAEPDLGNGFGGLTEAMLGLPPHDWLGTVNSELQRYPRLHSVLVDPFTGRLTSDTLPCGGDKWENNAIDAILALLREDQLFRLRRCTVCPKWFYALRDRQNHRFCSIECRQKLHSQSPEFKSKRADYMREKYRPFQKDQDANAQQQAKRVSGKSPVSRKGR